MRILVIGHTYIAPVNRLKWQTFVQERPNDIVHVMVPEHWPDALFTLHAHNAPPSSDNRCSFVALPVRRAGNEVLYGYRWRDLIHHMRTFEPDIISVEQGDNAWSYFQVHCAALFAAPRARRLFFTWINWRHPWSWKYRFFWQWIERFNRLFSHGAIVGNHDAQKLLRDKGFYRPAVIIPQLGITYEEHITPIAQRKKIIAFIGRLVEEKGIFDVLTAFDMIRQQFQDWKLLFIGDGPARSKLEQQIGAIGSSHIQRRPPVSHDEILRLLPTIAVLVLPSRDVTHWREQFGHILIEAMAAGVTVIGSDGGEIPHVIADAGIIVPQGNVAALSGALAQVLQNSALRESCAHRARARVEQHFTHAAIAQSTGAFFERLYNHQS